MAKITLTEEEKQRTLFHVCDKLRTRIMEKSVSFKKKHINHLEAQETIDAFMEAMDELFPIFHEVNISGEKVLFCCKGEVESIIEWEIGAVTDRPGNSTGFRLTTRGPAEQWYECADCGKRLEVIK